jgi:hypothetical protein
VELHDSVAGAALGNEGLESPLRLGNGLRPNSFAFLMTVDKFRQLVGFDNVQNVQFDTTQPSQAKSLTERVSRVLGKVDRDDNGSKTNHLMGPGSAGGLRV